MKNIFQLSICIILLSPCEKDTIFEAEYFKCNTSSLSINVNHPKDVDYQNLIDEMVSNGVPGIMMSIKDPVHGTWSSSSGKADLKSNINLLPCNITRVGSTVKTFTAVSIMLLVKEGKLSLDDPASEYLTQESLHGVKNADHATIRQLMQHRSGIYNYISNLNFQIASLNDLTKTWYPQELLSYARYIDADFPSGSDASYSNTNYIFLGQIIESVTGKPFYEFFESRIFQPLGMAYTQFAALDPVPDRIIQGYTDLFSNQKVINSTSYNGWDYFTADGGLISNPHDLTNFLFELFEGNVIDKPSLQEMLHLVRPSGQDPDGFFTEYGLGIFKIETEFGPAYIHSGDAIGYFATMLYFPEQKTAISWATNGNYGKIDEITQSKAAMEKIFKTVFEN